MEPLKVMTTEEKIEAIYDIQMEIVYLQKKCFALMMSVVQDHEEDENLTDVMPDWGC